MTPHLRFRNFSCDIEFLLRTRGNLKLNEAPDTKLVFSGNKRMISFKYLPFQPIGTIYNSSLGKLCNAFIFKRSNF